MRKTFLSLLLLLATGVMLHAQVEYVYFETRVSGRLTGDKVTLSGDHLNLHVKGKITPTLTYQLRQRFTKPLYDPKNPLNATDVLSLTWDFAPKWSVNAGKLPIFIGGYEWDDAPTDLYYWNDFANTIAQVYALGGTIMYQPREQQLLQFQFSHSLLHMGNPNVFNASLGWMGQFAPWWKTIWGINWMDDPYHHHMGYVALGNRFEVGPAALELDLMYRRSLIQKSAGFDGSVVARLEYRIHGQWILFAKGGWDLNEAVNVDPDGIAYDLTVAPGTRYLYGGGGVEYFPLGNRNLRLHLVGWADDRSRKLNLLLGLTFRLHLVK